MRIKCPLCGLRDSLEFTYDGDSVAQSKYPELNMSNPKKWVDYVFLETIQLANIRKFGNILEDVGNLLKWFAIRKLILCMEALYFPRVGHHPRGHRRQKNLKPQNLNYRMRGNPNAAVRKWWFD